MCSTSHSVSSELDITDIGPPQSTSSPDASARKQKRGKINKRCLRVLTVNFQSIKSKRETFWSMLEYTEPDIIIASETWLHPGNAEKEVLPDNYRFVARKDKKSDPHGGVAIIAKSDIEGVELDLNTNTEFVAASFSCKVLKKPLIVGSLYRPPNSGIPYTEELRNIISSLQSKHKDSTLWIGGDANLPDIDWKSSTVTGHNYLLPINNAFIDLMYDLGSEQIVDFPTRSSNTLDIFVTNRPTLVNKCIPIPGLSDHDIVMVDANIVSARQKPPKRLIYLWKQCNITDMEQDLHQSVQGFLKVSTTSTPIDSLWASFKSGRFSQPWCNRKIRRLARQKQRAFRKARRTGSNKVWLRTKELERCTQSECKSAYNNYVSDMITGDSTCKKLYSFIKGKKCDSSGIVPLKEDGVLHFDPKRKAELLNKQFSSVFTTEGDSDIPDMGQSNTPDAPDITVKEKGIHKLLKGLNPHKATGRDEMSTKLLKEMASPLSSALTLIFQASLNRGRTPHDWKSANVAPIFKKGDKSKPSNYRPVSLTSVCCKVLEHVIHSHLMKFFENNNILTDAQHGFRKYRSCESQLITTVQDLASGIDKSEQIDAVLLDFSKAFDKVPHRRLAAKLHHYGVRGNTLLWIQSFLADRSQKVIVEGQ